MCRALPSPVSLDALITHQYLPRPHHPSALAKLSSPCPDINLPLDAFSELPLLALHPPTYIHRYPTLACRCCRPSHRPWPSNDSE